MREPSVGGEHFVDEHRSHYQVESAMPSKALPPNLFVYWCLCGRGWRENAREVVEQRKSVAEWAEQAEAGVTGKLQRLGG